MFDVFQGIPESAEAPSAPGNVPSGLASNIPAQPQAGQPALVPSTGPNADPLDLFPQVLCYFLFLFSIHLCEIILVKELWNSCIGFSEYGFKCWRSKYPRVST